MVQEREELSFVVVGHVDHGKSTIVGRLLADTNSLPKGKLESIREMCRKNSRPFEYAFLLDALKEEQAQGITIDVSRSFFKTDKRDYRIIDAPGHIEFLKNMVTGASWADAALLVIDAQEGIQENSYRHGFLLSMLGIQQIAVLVNKMDLVEYNEQVFRSIHQEFEAFLHKIGIKTSTFIPVSGREGDSLTARSAQMPWYRGMTVLEQIDAFCPSAQPDEKPLRIPIQDVYKFTRNNDDRRIISGRIETGMLSVGDELVFYPSGKRSRVKTIEKFPDSTATIERSGWSIGFTLTEQIFVRRGDLAVKRSESAPKTASLVKVNLFWLGKQPLAKGKKYLFKINTTKVEMEVEAIVKVLDASSLSQKSINLVDRHDVAECILKLDRTIAFDLSANIPETGRFVIVDDYEIAGGGIITEAIEDRQDRINEKVQQRNIHWELSTINEDMRSERYNQRSCLILFTGSPVDQYRKQIAKEMEKRLFVEGKFTYFIGMANVLYGINSDIETKSKDIEIQTEHFRRLAEVSNLMLDAGLILIVSAREVSQEALSTLETVLMERSERVISVWAGDEITTNLQPDLHLREQDLADGVGKIKDYLQQRGLIFRP